MSVEQANGLPGNHEEEPARQASEGSYLDNASGVSYQPNGTVAGDDLPYPIREGVTCLPVQEQGSSLIAMPCFQSVSHVTTHCSVSNARRTALCYQEVTNVDWPPNLISSTGNIERAMEHTCTDEEIRNWKQKLARSKPQEARKKKNARNPSFIFKITEVAQHRENETAIFTDAVYNDHQEKLFGIRIHPKGVGGGRGRHVALFIHLIKGDFDNSLVWPFDGIVTISVLDQSDCSPRRDLIQIIQANPDVPAFQQPGETICRTGYGYERFAPIEEFFGPRYVKDDAILLKIEFSG
ncbi:TNF receptor-associated factor 6-A-like [Montipora foliosa]|uniref:TNF receptor-associated factor 6-A-like n=1 Tax=Montipora foliosa TaxID=591990 RepID=UPI0035F15DA9